MTLSPSKQWLESHYSKKGLSALKIAKLSNCNVYHVYKWLGIYKIKIRQQGGKKKPIESFTSEWFENAYWTEKNSLSKISKKTKMSISTVQNQMIKFGIPRRTIAEAMLDEKPMYGRRGPKSHMWKGGKNSINNQIRECHQFDLWRKEIFKRDNYTCQFCKLRGGTLNADHIKQLARIIDEFNLKTMEEAYVCKVLWELSNGRTLCEKCHKTTETHSRYLKSH